MGPHSRRRIYQYDLSTPVKRSARHAGEPRVGKGRKTMVASSVTAADNRRRQKKAAATAAGAAAIPSTTHGKTKKVEAIDMKGTGRKNGGIELSLKSPAPETRAEKSHEKNSTSQSTELSLEDTKKFFRTLCDEITQQRRILPVDEVSAFDMQWGLDPIN